MRKWEREEEKDGDRRGKQKIGGERGGGWERR